MVNQLIKNGDFSGSLKGWVNTNSVLSMSGGKLHAIGLSNGDVITSSDKYTSLPAGTYTYTYAKMRALDDDCTALVAQDYLDGLYSNLYVEYLNPTVNHWYEVHGKNITKTSSDRTKLRARYSNGSGKGLEVEMCMKFIISSYEYNNMSNEELKAKYVDGGYIDGFQPARGIAIESVGKNLLPNHKILQDKFLGTSSGEIIDVVGNSVCPDFIKVNANTDYTLQMNEGEVGYRIAWYDESRKYIDASANSTGAFKTINTGDDIQYIRIAFANGTDGSKATFVEGLVGLSYEPYKSSKIVIEDALAKSPNGKMDKIACQNGKIVKYVETNVGRDGELYTIKDSDFVDVYTEASHVNLVRLNLSSAVGAKAGTSDIDGFMKVEGFNGEVQPLSAYYNSANAVGKISMGSTQYWLIVDKVVCPDLATAKKLYTGTKVTYELAEPYAVKLSDKTEALNCV